MKAMKIFSALIAAAALPCACVDSGPGPQAKPIDRKYVAANLVTTTPGDLQPSNVSFGGRVELAGTTAERAQIAPGQTMHVQAYWRVLVPPGDGWRVLAQLRGDPGTADFMNLDASDMELGHPLAAWRAGELIRDEHVFVLRPDWKSKTATLYLGLVRDGGHDDAARMAAIGPTGAAVAHDVAVARVFDVDLSHAPPPPGTIYIPRATAPIAIDGIGNDPGWAGAVVSPEFVAADGSPDPVGKTIAKLTWDDQYLYAFVSITDPDIVSPYKQHDDPLYKADAIELFIDADNNRRGYIELQVNPNGATFDKWWPQTRAQDGDESWESGMTAAVKLRGTTEPGDTDQGWDAEIAIPWAAVKGRDDAMKVNLPPHVGDRWRLNIVRSDQKTGGTHQAEAGASSWNKIGVGDFHALDKMLNVVFADHGGSIVAKPDAAVAPDVGVPPAAGSGQGSGSNGSGSAASAGSASTAPAVFATTPAARQRRNNAGSAGSAEPGAGSSARP